MQHLPEPGTRVVIPAEDHPHELEHALAGTVTGYGAARAYGGGMQPLALVELTSSSYITAANGLHAVTLLAVHADNLEPWPTCTAEGCRTLATLPYDTCRAHELEPLEVWATAGGAAHLAAAIAALEPDEVTP